MPIPVAALSKGWVCGRSLAGIAGSNPTGVMDVFLFQVLCVLREISETGRSLVQASLTQCDVSEYEASTRNRSKPNVGSRKKKIAADNGIVSLCIDKICR